MPTQDGDDAQDDADRALQQAIVLAMATRPELTIDPAVFEQHVRARLAGGSAGGGLPNLAFGDLYLALGCLLRDEAALAVFERECIGTIDRIVAHMRLPDAHVDELKQAVRTKLLVAEGDRPAKISDYKGKGPLRSWVGVVATRQALSRLRRKHEDSPGDSALLGIESPHSGPELGFLKLHYREQFVRAFKAALAELDAGSRNSLRHHYVHGLTIDELAALYRIHRSNAARRVAKARDALLSGTRRRLVRELGIDRSEFESIMRLIESRLEVSIAGVLGDDR